jgi:hypothetical protein
VVTTWTGSYNRQINLEEQQIYDHLLHWIDLETPDQMIERFRLLFIDGSDYPDGQVAIALDKVIASRLAEEEFRYVLNRCCHILVNRWQSRSQSQIAIPNLIQLFETLPSAASLSGAGRSRSVRRLRELTSLFTETEQYLTLRRLAEVLTQAAAEAEAANAGSRPLSTLIRRYPYLYEHCLLSEDSTQEQQNTVKSIQSEVQRKFEIDLSQYVTYQVRRSQISSRIVTPNTQRLIRPVANPTLLSNQELGQAVLHYVGKVEGTKTYRDLACSFLVQSEQTHSYRDFKDDLYEYITASIDVEYGNRRFYNQLHAHLENTMSESNGQRLNDFLLVRTCSQLLNFLVVDSSQQPHHFVFIDLITNLGPVLTTGLLLKVVLLCRKVKPYLERRLSILFNHYETYSRDAVQWLVLALENLNIALSAHFGGLNLSFVC